MTQRIAILPARGGSTRIPRKNVALFGGRPMIEWPILAAKDLDEFTRLVVSTDDEEIGSLALWNGCEVHPRPRDDGTLGTNALAGRVLRELAADPNDEVCVIYPCSPMLRGEDLFYGYDAFARFPDRYTYSVLAGPGSLFVDAGCYYWARAERFMRNAPMTPLDQRIAVDRRRFIDINTPQDWARAESMFNALRRAP